MRSTIKILTVLAFFAALAIIAAPASAAPNAVCIANPGAAPVGSVFHIACSGYSPNTTVNIYAVEPDGRTSGLNIYGFFPTIAKTDSSGTAGFAFRTEAPGVFSVPPGDYTFVMQELAPGGGVAVLGQITVTVQSSDRPLVGAVLVASKVGTRTFAIAGFGWAPGEGVNIWVTQPPGTQCSGLGIDQLTLGALPGNGSSLWTAPGTVRADASGNIGFTIAFRPSACTGDYTISARALGSGIGAEVTVTVSGSTVVDTGALVFVNPSSVPAFRSRHTVSGTGFPANTGVNCWYTRPDGRVLFFINANATTDASGSFAVSNSLDDFPPFTSTEPGWWTVTCATTSRSALGEARFLVYALMSDP